MHLCAVKSLLHQHLRPRSSRRAVKVDGTTYRTQCNLYGFTGLFATFTSIPAALSSADAHSKCPPRAAQCSGVDPALSSPFTDTLFDMPFNHGRHHIPRRIASHHTASCHIMHHHQTDTSCQNRIVRLTLSMVPRQQDEISQTI